MKDHRNFFTLAALMALLSACQLSITGEGNLVKQNRRTAPFRKIELNIPARVTIIIADSSSVVVVAQKNLQEYILTKNEGETMNIESSRRLQPTKPIEIVMTCSPQEALTINGSGDIFIVNSFKSDKLRISINGSGDVHAHLNTRKIISEINGSGDIFLDGKSENHNLEINGSGKLMAENLITEKYDIEINGSGDANVHATSKLSVKLTGSGEINYLGQPKIDSQIIGSGELKRVRE